MAKSLFQKVSHPKWKPSTKIFYAKYHTCIKLGLFPKHAPAFIPLSYGKCRVVNRTNSNGKITSDVYTDNQEIIDHIMTDAYLHMHIISITGPATQQHLEFMVDSRNVTIRDELWYGKFQHKMTLWRPYNYTDTDEVDLVEAYDYLLSNFKDARMNGKFRHRGFGQFPTVFTNDEAAIFLFKLAFSQKLSVRIDSIIQLKDVLKA